MDKDFMESVWWAFKTLYEKGKIYEGRKVLMYDTKFCTPVSKAEVTMDNDAYQTVTDPSAYVLFKSELGYLLAWTTTPWTLPANLALAVSPKLEYGIYEVEGKKVILATKLASKLFEDIKPEQKFKGSKLVGLSYEPIIETVPEKERKEGTYKVHGAEFVSSEEGTGIVHIAPAYGEDDYALGTAEEVDFVDVLDENGYYLPEMAEKLHELGVRDTDENGMESEGRGRSIKGMGLLPVKTFFASEKARNRVEGYTGTFEGKLQKISGKKVSGYEIHMGCSERSEEKATSFFAHDGKEDGCVKGSVAGTYLHGLFDEEEFREAFLDMICEEKGIDRTGEEELTYEQYREAQYDKLADILRESLDMEEIYRVLGL